MKTPIEAVIWDMGGVLLHMGDETPRHQLSHEYHIPLDKIYWAIFDSPSAQAAGIGKITVQQHWQNIGQYLEIPQENLSEFLRQFWSTDDIDRPLIDFIQALRSGYRTGLLSNAWDNLRSLIDDYWRVAGAFDDIVISADVGLAKPDPRIYQLALERLGISPEAAIFIDDVEENVEAARQVGMHAIQFKTRRQVLMELHELLKNGSGRIPDQIVRLIAGLEPGLNLDQ